MTYDRMWPDARPDFEPKDYGIFRSDASGPCVICGTVTHWIDLAYEAWICSTDCVAVLDTGALDGREIPASDPGVKKFQDDPNKK